MSDAGDRLLRLGIVGCGRLTMQGYLPALELTSRVGLAAVADTDAGRRRAVVDACKSPGVEPGTVSEFASAEGLVGSGDVDAVVIATPVDSHVEVSTLTAGTLPVLLEKPPAPDASGAARIAALPAPPSVGFNRRFDVGARGLRAGLPSDGRLDLDLSIHYRRSGWGAYTATDDAWLDLGPHLVDWARWLSCCEIVEVTSADLVMDHAVVRATTERGRVLLSARTDRVHREHIIARGPTGDVLGSHRLGGVRAAVADRVRPRPSNLVRTLAAQLDAFAASVRADPAPPDAEAVATAEDGLAVMKVIDAARALDQRSS